MDWLLVIAIFTFLLAGLILAWQAYRLQTFGPRPATPGLLSIVEPRLEQSAMIVGATTAWLINLIFLYTLKILRRLTTNIRYLFTGAEKKVGQTIGQVHRQYQIKKRRLPIKWGKARDSEPDLT